MKRKIALIKKSPQNFQTNPLMVKHLRTGNFNTE
jgi:hypothetical protein